LGEYRNKTIEKWKPTVFNGKLRMHTNNHSKVYSKLKQRASYCHEYIGGGIEGYGELLLPIQQLRNDKMVNKEIFSRFFG